MPVRGERFGREHFSTIDLTRSGHREMSEPSFLLVWGEFLPLIFIQIRRIIGHKLQPLLQKTGPCCWVEIVPTALAATNIVICRETFLEAGDGALSRPSKLQLPSTSRSSHALEHTLTRITDLELFLSHLLEGLFKQMRNSR
jgi:hypothetical protein